MADKVTFTSKINGNDIYAKRAERTRSGVNLETFTPAGEGATTTYGILPAGITTPTVANDEANTLATQKYVKDAFSVADALVYKGTVAGGDTGDYGALTPAASKGWTYKVTTAGKIDGVAVEVGDMLICNTDSTPAATSSDYTTVVANWDFVQTNLDGIVIGPESAVDGNIALFNGTTGKLIKNGANLALSNSPASKAIVTNAQGAIVDADLSTAAPSASGDTLAFIDSVSQDSQGKITATKKSVTVDSTYSASGTNPVNGTAVAAALATLDADVTSSDGTNVQVKVTEVAGKVTAVNITTDNTANKDHVHGNITNDGKVGSTADLAVVTGTAGAVTTADMTTADPTVPSTGTTTATAFIDSVSQDSKGKITASKKNLPEASTSTKGIVQLAGSIGDTVETENNKAATEKAVRDAINALDVSNITSTLGAGKTITALSETDGKIAATASDIAITGAQVTVASATNGNFAGFDASGHVVDSGKKAADFKPVQTAVVDPTASGDASAFIATISQDANGVITATKANLPIAEPTSGGVTHPGLVTYETVEL